MDKFWHTFKKYGCDHRLNNLVKFDLKRKRDNDVKDTA